MPFAPSYLDTRSHILNLVRKCWVIRRCKVTSQAHHLMPSLLRGARFPALSSQSSRMLAVECWEYPERKGKWHHSGDLPYQAGSPGAACTRASKHTENPHARADNHRCVRCLDYTNTLIDWKSSWHILIFRFFFVFFFFFPLEERERHTEVPMKREEAITSISSAENFPRDGLNWPHIWQENSHRSSAGSSQQLRLFLYFWLFTSLYASFYWLTSSWLTHCWYFNHTESIQSLCVWKCRSRLTQIKISLKQTKKKHMSQLFLK